MWTIGWGGWQSFLACRSNLFLFLRLDFTLEVVFGGIILIMAKRGEIDPSEFEKQVAGLVKQLVGVGELDDHTFHRYQKKHARLDGRMLRKTEVIAGIRWLVAVRGWEARYLKLIPRILAKPGRTLSGVAPVTVLTKPFPCPGECIFCPSDARMPKSYLSDEPGAQRAEANKFNPYLQVYNRLRVYAMNGHATGKIELIILGGSWSSYPVGYRRWFVKECFRAMNEFDQTELGRPSRAGLVWYQSRLSRNEVRRQGQSYNLLVGREDKRREVSREQADWREVVRQQRKNERAGSRCVGLSVETRPDLVTVKEAVGMRRLGVTKVQVGLQSLDDEILRLNRRGHGVEQTRQALGVLRKLGFKLQGHWMANLYGSTPTKDKKDFGKIWGDLGVRVDELKIYPCALVKTAELYDIYMVGKWKPATKDELLDVVKQAMLSTPRYCRLSRVGRDFSAGDIAVGNKKTNLREMVDAEIERADERVVDIRAREVRSRLMDGIKLKWRVTEYDTLVSSERFIELVTEDDELAGFCRLSLPQGKPLVVELAGCAVVRELHVYGRAVGVGEKAGEKWQHRGLGKRLMGRAERLAREAGYVKLAVISAVGTREYYRRLGYMMVGMYMIKINKGMG